MVEAAAVGDEDNDVFGGMFEFVLIVIVAEVFTLLGFIKIIFMRSVPARKAGYKGNTYDKQADGCYFKYMRSYLHRQVIITNEQAIPKINTQSQGFRFCRESI
jgi:hypothetical protein